MQKNTVIGVASVLLALMFGFAGCNLQPVEIDASVKLRISDASGGAEITAARVGSTIYAVPYDKDKLGDTAIYYYKWFADGEPITYRDGSQSDWSYSVRANQYTLVNDSPVNLVGKRITVKLEVKDWAGNVEASAESNAVTVTE
ncbi:MAG: hypothetical protein LBG87_09425 [Spirochaetaceae bacterium]|jgi:hypothetical protein|nr:hypothetical protein [Spirochaetaceae bacterium]